ncbi:hypothetical protein ABID82_006791 [Methylobacterium sp. PvP062]|uniref:Secreted protein n=1 Tax=Methylobacterium radiotolerans TaxID=31998 RepID=A0ABV2N8X7_9HYPH|nr:MULTISPECIES: hypothetical protein [unclassified Methylobacterium]MBP2493807.1 hypothetical protein [Methylobacterium sp. PvP105]MBP2499820.1 hypothetical protein [Methylobacterium sp. PvP109]MCX7336213.1 hypothetical protein [Hyphomicrobiales bacterium]
MYAVLILALVLCLISPAGAASRRDSRTLAQAAYVLRHALPITSTKLKVLSADRALLTGGDDGAVIVTRINHCSYSIMSTRVGGYRINFSRLYGTFEREGTAEAARIVLPGNSDAACSLPLDGPDQCASTVMLKRVSPQQEATLLAGVTYLLDRGCRASAAPVDRP